jgi:hypothetical membrane protein
MRQIDRDQAGLLLGVTAIAVTFLGIFGAVALSPSFAWSENALSNLGDAGHPAGTATTELLFNGGLILGGLLGVGFAATLALRERVIGTRLGAVVFGLAMASMAGVGVFPQDRPLHFEVAVGLYMLFSVAGIVYGAGSLLEGRRRVAAVSGGLGVTNLAIWIGWVGTVGIDAPGLAIPEILGAGCIGTWALWQAREFRGNASG